MADEPLQTPKKGKKHQVLVQKPGESGGRQPANNSYPVISNETRRNCGKYTRKEKKLTLWVIVLSILCFGLLSLLFLDQLSALLLLSNWQTPILGFEGICDSKECVDIAHDSLEAGDFTLDPCVDFHKYSCSRWMENNPVKQEQLYHAANINVIRDKTDLYFKDLLEEPEPAELPSIVDFDISKSLWSEYQPVRDFYFSCLNYTVPNEDKLIIELVDIAGGYWKKGEKWHESYYDLTRMVLKFLKMNAAPLFDVSLDIDARNRSRYVLIIELPRPTSLVPNLFSRKTSDDEQYSVSKSPLGDMGDLPDPLNLGQQNLKPEMQNGRTMDRQTLYKMITDNMEEKKLDQLRFLLRRLGSHINVPEEELANDMGDIVFISQSIQKLVPSQRTRKFWKQKNRVYNEFKVDDLQMKFDAIDWRYLLQELLQSGHHQQQVNADNQNYIEKEINWDEVLIYVPYPDYLRRVFNAVQFTNKRLLYNTMLLLYVRDLKSDLQQEKHHGSSSGSSEDTPSSDQNDGDREEVDPRWKFCVHSTKSVFAMELSRMYLESFPKSYLENTRRDVEEIFENVKESMWTLVENSKWIEGQGKNEVLKKIASLRGNFIGPTFYFDQHFLQNSLKGIKISPNDFHSNIRLVYQTFREELYQLFWSKVDEDKATWAFVTFPFIVNAFYIQQFNSLVIPLAFLSSPQYVKNSPKYISYATLGLSIAHEALHAFDLSGSNFDANGELQDSSTWDFLHEKSQCISKQYSSYFKKIISFYETIVPIQVDGNLTQNENMADIAGLQVAFKAYLNWRNKNPEKVIESELKMPAMKFTLNQMYFLAVAQAYCANISPVGYVFLLEMDEHTTHPERINGALMNNDEFSRAFSCQKGSRMNPKHKCTFW